MKCSTFQLDNLTHVRIRPQVLNSQYTFSEAYMNCVSQNMDEMKPFGDVPKKLTVEVKRAFVATRTFVQALAIGRDVVKYVQEVSAITVSPITVGE